MHSWMFQEVIVKMKFIFPVVFMFICYQTCNSMNLPDLWIKYLSWLKEWYSDHPNTCIPQVLYPNTCQMRISVESNLEGRYLLTRLCCLPPVLIWNPLHQYPFYNIQCPVCRESMSVKKWNVAQDKGSKPRVIHDIDCVVLLIGIVYRCPNSHQIVSYDPRILCQIPDASCTPFALTHRSGFTRRFLHLLIANIEHGNDFSHVLSIIENCRSSFIEHVQRHHLIECFSPPALSRFTLTSVFMQHFFIEKEEFFNSQMSDGTSNDGWLCIDHTFKVASNVGYLRSDGKWITQYHSVFIIMNNIGRVLSWQFTRSESTSEIRSIMQGLMIRSRKLNFIINYIMLDNCCQWNCFLQDVFGMHIKVKLDLFHAVQRITKTFSRKDPNYNMLVSELRLVFRAAGDVGKFRTMPTPLPQAMIDNLEAFVLRWKAITNLNNTTQKEIENLKKHIVKGCLSGIPPGIGTNKNEALHKHINPYFGKSRLGVQAAYALLCILFYLHNKKTETASNLSNDPTVLQQKDVCNLRAVQHDHQYDRKEQFGVIGKQERNFMFWGASTLMPFQEISDLSLENHNEDAEYAGLTLINFDQGKKILASVINIVKMMQNINDCFLKSPLLGPNLFSLMRSPSHLSRSDTSSLQCHEDRLNEVIRISGLQRIVIEGDGNCCFTAISQALKILFEKSITCVKEEMESLPVEFKTASIQFMSDRMRQIVFNEWMEFEHEYRDFLVDEEANFEVEASKFLANGFFMSSLGDTVLKAASNALGIPIIVLTSIDEMPVLKFEPRNFCVHAPLLIAYNQFGAGHYDALSYVSSLPSIDIKGSHHHATHQLSCKCGINQTKGAVNKASCCQNSQYSCRCPCLKHSVSCSSKCSCKHCQNPFGQAVRPKPKTRVRYSHALRSIHLSNSAFLMDKQEKLCKGSWSQYETVLLIEVESFLKQKNNEVTVHDIHELYHQILGLLQINNIKIAIGCKSVSSIMYKLQQLKKLKQTLSSI